MNPEEIEVGQQPTASRASKENPLTLFDKYQATFKFAMKKTNKCVIKRFFKIIKELKITLKR